MPILEVKDLKKTYTTRFGGQQVHALTSVNFAVEPGEYVAIMGESGSGKTTLLNILAALDKPTSGSVLLDGKDIVAIRERDISAFRRDHLGFVFQDFNLLHSGQHTPAPGAGGQELPGDAAPPDSSGPAAGAVGAAEKISLRGLRRSEAAHRRGPRPDYRAPAGAG